MTASQRNCSWLVQVTVGGALLGALAVVFLSSALEWNRNPLLIGLIQSTDHGVALLGIVTVAYGIRPFTGIPTGVLNLVVGVQFGLVPGVPIAVVGMVLTAVPMYAAGVYSKQLPTWIPGLQRVADLGEQTIDDVGATRGMLAASFSPTPLDPVSYVAGISGVPLRVFIATTFVGAIPWAGGYCYVGALTGEIVSDMTEVPLFLVFLGVAVASVLLVRPIHDRIAG